MKPSRLAAAVASVGLTGSLGLGCFATPTPLAPGLEGSIGWPHHGVQTGAIELPERGEGFVRYRSTGGHYWGQPALVDGLRAAARRVVEDLPGGPALVVGDLSAQFGGKIERHYSHRSGRDVDLLWFVTTLDGQPIQNSAFVPLGPRGVGRIPGRGYVRLDADRQWRLIEALLGSPHLDVQWLYASNLVKSLLIEHATERGANPELIARAQTMMRQPLDGLPHDDHLHLRIACPENRAPGCVGGGPYWGWLASSSGLDSPPQSALTPDATAAESALDGVEVEPLESGGASTW